MHIAIDARIVNSTTGRYVERLVHYLQEIDTENTYTILVPEKDKDYLQLINENFHILVADYDNYSIGEQLGFKKFLDRLRPDLVHFCMPQQPVLYKGLHVTTFHDLTLVKTYNSDKNWLIYHFKQRVGEFVFKHVAKTSQHILTPSQFTKDELIKYVDIPEEKVTVTHLAADSTNSTPSPYVQPFKKFLLYVGQQSDYKNIRRLASAHQRLIKKHPDLGLILVGSKNASARKNEQYFDDKNYKNILFTGFLPDDQLEWLYEHTAAYVFPSLMEGFGLPGLEAMIRNTPVVSSNATCLPEIYGEAAHYFDPNNTTDMARAIDEVLEDDTLRSTLIEAGKSQAKKYSWKKTARQTHDVYMNALENFTKS